MPGPGSYETSSCFETFHKNVHRSSQRFHKRNSLKNTSNIRIETSRGNRTHHDSFETPGPGKYTINSSSLSRTRGITMAKKYEKRNTQTLPGPADYENLTSKSLKGGKIGNAKRLLMLREAFGPSPQSYHAEKNTTRKSHPKFTFPSSRKAIVIEDSPGPAPVLVKEIFNSRYKTPKLKPGTSSMLSRTKKSTLSIREGPGPGKYFPS